METIREILGLPFDDERRAKYNANAINKRISKVIIDGNTIRGYKAFSFLWEKTYIKSPERSANGTIGNLNSYATFVTPHLQIDFSLLSIDDYRKIMDLIYSRNEHTVQCYDIVYDKITVNKMYFATESMPKLEAITRQLQTDIGTDGYTYNTIEVIGVRDYTIELIGTNAQLGGLTVTYHPNIPSGISSSLTGVTVDVADGEEILVGVGTETIMETTLTDTASLNWSFKVWNTKADETGTSYTLNEVKKITQNTELYAIWLPNDTFTLSYNYGLGAPEVDNYGNAIYSKEIKIGDAYGELYESAPPTVKFMGGTYTPYIGKGWFKNPNGLGTALSTTTTYDIKGNSTIYQVFEPISYTLTFETNGGTQILPITNAYNSAIAIPIPQKDGFAFGGWYYDDGTFKEQFGGYMPPKDKTIYAKWVEVQQ